jgi:nicotinate phosphoribosyltransferase
LEKKFLQDKCGDYLPPTFIDLLAGYRFDSNELKITLDENNKLEIEIEGYWYRTILWEVPLMALISELYFIKTGQKVQMYKQDNVYHDIEKVTKMLAHNAYFADFGTRRRYSYENQDRIVKLFSELGGDKFVGTSNVHFAMKYNTKPIGTMAHEWIMVHAALYGYKMSNTMALENWVDVYGGRLGTALSDTYTTGVFFKSFDTKLSKLFDGVRHDSGDPFEFTDKVIEHYKSLGINPMSKVIVFSDGLNTELATEIKEYCVGKIMCSFGIGTHFTNDLGVRPLNMVIKISEVWVNGEWVHAVKLSDNPGKNTGDPTEVALSKQVLHLS